MRNFVIQSDDAVFVRCGDLYVTGSSELFNLAQTHRIRIAGDRVMTTVTSGSAEIPASVSHLVINAERTRPVRFRDANPMNLRRDNLVIGKHTKSCGRPNYVIKDRDEVMERAIQHGRELRAECQRRAAIHHAKVTAEGSPEVGGVELRGATLEQRIAALEQLHASTTERLTREHTARIESLTRRHNARMEKLTRRYTKQVARLTRDATEGVKPAPKTSTPRTRPGVSCKNNSLRSPDGRVFTNIRNFAQFCRDHELDYMPARSVACGQRSGYAGWTLPTDGDAE